ncbi:hypothetical protein ABT084_11755 [Streptomyces sp. NPDC002138]|uniref:hypothetical protein n=1 Tax=Streptomyces sp. NPDC002138 TaxID=3154410 RepID=UPI003332B437
MTAGVHQAVAANIARTKAEGTDRWAEGIDVARILLDAHAAGAGVDQTVAAVTTAAAT